MLKVIIIYILFTCCSYAIDPKKEYIFKPGDIGLLYKQNLLNNNGVLLNSWLVYAKSNKEQILNWKTILLVYGDFGNMSYYSNYIEFYSNLGYNVITFDFRGFGASSDFTIDKSKLYYNEFVEDFLFVLNYYKEKININNITISSLSMGSIVTVLGVRNIKINQFIFEGAVLDDYKVIDRLQKIKDKKLSSPNIKRKLKNAWKEINGDIYIIAGNDDVITTIKDAKVIAKKCNAKLLVLEGGHLSLLHDAKSQKQFIELFIRK